MVKMSGVLDYMQLCRLCLVKDKVNVPIFGDATDVRQIFLKITACLPVKISQDDNLPKNICDSCLYKVDLLYQFYNTTANAEKQLIQWLDEIGVDVNIKSAGLPPQLSHAHPHSMKVDSLVKEERHEAGEGQHLENSAEYITSPQLYVGYNQQFAQANTSHENNGEHNNTPVKRTRGRPSSIKKDQTPATTTSTNKLDEDESMDEDSSDRGGMQDDSDDSMEETGGRIAKEEAESEEEYDVNAESLEPTTFVGVPNEAPCDADQPGPSGLNKPAVSSTDTGYDDMKSYISKQIDGVDDDILNTDEAKIIDQDLINLLSVEDDCSKLENITSTNEHFEKLIEQHEIDETGLEVLRTDMMEEEKKNINDDVIVPDINEEEIGELITKEFCNDVNNPNDLNIMTESDVDDILYAPDLNIMDNDLDIDVDLDMGLKLLEEELKCPYCQKEYKTKKLLTYHIMSHTNDKKWKCDICDKKFKHRYEVAVHKRTHLEPGFECEICSKKFTQNSHLTTHKKRHFSEYVEFCEPCQKGYYSRSQYKNHVNVTHKQVWHICEICGCKLSTKSALKEHMATHDQRTRTAICEICGKTYLNSRNLKNHLKTHTQQTGYNCKICGKVVSGKKTLEVHIRTHTGEKPVQCNICDKSFASKSYLKSHLRTHTGVKPYCCVYCRKSFSQRSSLTIHTRYHTGERPYTCTTCGKGFVNRTHLNGHIKTHEFNNKVDESTIFSSEFI